MQGEPTTVILADEQLESLERRLMIRARSGAPDRSRSGSANAFSSTREEDGGDGGMGPDPAAAIPDILASFRDGATIAPQTETRPLIPLFAAAGKPIPPEMQVDHEKLGYDFYSVEIAFSVLLPRGQHPLNAALGLRLADDVTAPARRTRPIQLFPGHKDVSYFKVDVEAAVGIDASMQLALPATLGGLPLPFAKMSADAKLKAGIVVGPFSFPICNAAVEVRGEQSQEIFWRYNMESTLSGANTFKSVLVLKVANEAGLVSCDASLKVTPYKPSWVFFKELLPALECHMKLPVELVR